MKKILFDFTPYVLDSWSIMITRYSYVQMISQTLFIAHKIDGKIVFENFEEDSYPLNEAETNYINTILLNS